MVAKKRLPEHLSVRLKTIDPANDEGVSRIKSIVEHIALEHIPSPVRKQIALLLELVDEVVATKNGNGRRTLEEIRSDTDVLVEVVGKELDGIYLARLEHEGMMRRRRAASSEFDSPIAAEAVAEGLMWEISPYY